MIENESAGFQSCGTAEEAFVRRVVFAIEGRMPTREEFMTLGQQIIPTSDWPEPWGRFKYFMWNQNAVDGHSGMMWVYAFVPILNGVMAVGLQWNRIPQPIMLSLVAKGFKPGPTVSLDSDLQDPTKFE